MKTLFVLILFSNLNSVFADEINCAETLNETKKALASMRANVKIGKDIDEEFELYQSGMEELIECPKELKNKSLVVKDNEIAAFRKFMYAPDRSANLSEAQCTEVKVSTQHMPKNSHQNQLNWCFAFTAADLLSFYEQVPLSAYDIALQYHNNDEVRAENEIDPIYKKRIITERGGNPIRALQLSLNDKGICLESETDYLNHKWEELSGLFKTLADSKDSFSKLMCELNLKDVVPFQKLEPEVLSILNKLSSDKKVAAFLDLSCKQRHVPANDYRLLTQFMGRPGVTQDKMMNKLDSILSKSEPVTIGYDPKILDHGVNYQGKEQDHASTVIGRKFNKQSGQCEYLIKNTWGDDVDCQKTPSVSCEKGNYWVSRTLLKKNLSEIDWLEKKPAKPSPEIQK